MNRTTANLLLLATAVIWGAAFVPQQTAMRVMSPMWFLVLRFAISLAVMVPLALREHRRTRSPIPRRAWLGYLLIGVVFLAGNVLQQTSLTTTSVTNAGFLTSLYILFTPFAAMALTRERPGVAVWPAAGLGLIGAWLLSGGVSGDLVIGDVLVTIGAVAWALQIVLIGIVARLADRPTLLVAIQCAIVLIGCGGWAIAHDPISWQAVVTALPELLYTGVVSGCLAYTLQVIAQRHTRASDAAIVFSSEAPFAALSGVVLLGDTLSLGQWAGSAAIFAAVLLVQLWPSPAGERA